MGCLSRVGFSLAVVEFELFFAFWLVSGVYPRATWVLAVVCFVTFASYSLWRATSGAASCGCFGRIEVNPWHTFAFDVLVVGALFLWRPRRHVVEETHERVGHARFARVACFVAGLWLVVGIPIGFVMASYRSSTVDSEGLITGDSEFVLLEPKRWLDKRFPLVSQIDIGDQLTTGSWVVLMYHHGCPTCQKVTAKCSELAITRQASANAPRVALVEIPPFERSNPVDRHHVKYGWLHGKLNETREWFVETPVLIVLRDGSVIFAEIGEDVLATGLQVLDEVCG